MSLTVVSVAYPLAPVGPDAVGGAEQVLAHLDRALVASGHRSIVIACEGSQTAGSLVAGPAFDGELNDAAIAKAHASVRTRLACVLARERVDVVHLHGIDCFEYLPQGEVPVLITLHLPPEWYPPAQFETGRPHTYLHCVSESQHARCPQTPNLLPPISNGVPIASFSPAVKGNYAVALGRICPEKGFHVAVDAAARAKVPLVIAGQVYGYEAHRRYFESELLPKCDGERTRFVGPVGGARKQALLAGAGCLLVPSLVPETSSLVAMEALAAGTPVIAFPNGALPEIVEHGRTGFLVRDAAEMAASIGRVSEIDPGECRRVARSRFSLDQMTAAYLKRYEELAAHASIGIRESAAR